MRNKYIFVLVMLVCISLVSAGLTRIYISRENNLAQDNNVTIVTSFYPMYIAALNITDGVDGISLRNLSEPQTGCLHDFQLTPEDMKLLSTADIFVVNGGGIESFMTDVANSYPDLNIVEACEGLELLACDFENEEEEHHDDHEEEEHEHDSHEHGDVNAHAWMSVKLYRQQVEKIANQLAKVDAEHADDYIANAAIYDGKLAELQKLQENVIKNVKNSNVVLLHESFFYIADEYGINVSADMDLDEERQISAGEVADIINAIKHDSVAIIFAEELYGSDMGKTLESETDAKVVYLNPLNRGEYDKDSYISGMQSNIDAIRDAFLGKDKQ